MKRSQVKVHTSFVGHTGYNIHAQNFCKQLAAFHDLQVRNYTVGPTWSGYSDSPHDREPEIDQLAKKLLVEQTLYSPNGHEDFKIYSSHPNEIDPKIHIVLNDLNHHYFYQEYAGFKIAYNVWETTRWPDDFFQQLLKHDQLWVPSEWQRGCAIEQGYPAERVKVVPEGVDPATFFPVVDDSKLDRPFRFLVAGRWEYRKSTKEIIKAFCEEFASEPEVELHLLVDNPFASDDLRTTDARLSHYGLDHPGIRVIHTLDREDYVHLLQTTSVFVSCSRGEGWNLPLIEAMACGVPSIYSEWGAQLEFASGLGIPVKVLEERPADFPNADNWIANAPGNLCEPDFGDLKRAMRDSFLNWRQHRLAALEQSETVRDKFSWHRAAEKAATIISEIESKKAQRWTWVTCGDAGYMPIIETLAESLQEFSSQPLLIYGINCDPAIALNNVISRRLDVEIKSPNEKWYWKQIACLQSFKEEGEIFVWIDGDVVVNHNIDRIENHFTRLSDYPLSEIHHLTEHLFHSTGKPSQRFVENLAKKHGVERTLPFMHACFYVYNRACEWWFNEILKEYVSIPFEEYQDLNPWNDEGIDNMLRWKHNRLGHLPLSNFDVSSYLGSKLGDYGNSLYFFLNFMDREGPQNFGDIYGFQQVPKDKSGVLYFHGNKDPKVARTMIDVLKLRRDSNFLDSGYFYVKEFEVKDLGSISGVPGSTMEIAARYGWDYAIYHEVYNLLDYEWNNTVKIEKGDVVVDLGANLGVFSRFAYQRGASKILSFEPDRRYFKALRKNVGPNTFLFKAAISDSLGKMRFTEAAHLGGSNLLIEENVDHTQYPVDTYTLDHLFSTGYLEKIDFLKVDIEGAETLAFAGISDDNLRKVRKIAMEWHHAHLKHDDVLRAQFIHRLNTLGFNSMLLNTATNDLQMIYFWK